MPATVELLREATDLELPVAATYGGYSRLFCPHVLGYKRGILHVLGCRRHASPQWGVASKSRSYQYAGESASALPPRGEWQCMEVEKLQIVQVRAGPWRTGRRGGWAQTCIDEVIVVVDKGS